MLGIAQKVLADPGKYSIQQLQQGVQSGVIPAYIAIPIIQSKIQEQKQSQLAQSMQQPPAQTRPPVAQQVMAEARGLDTLPTNLPSQYAAGGIVAFDKGGEVERFQFGGVAGGGGLYDPERDPLVTEFITRRNQQAGLVGINPLAGPRLPNETFDAFKQRVLQADAQAQAQRVAQETQARETERLKQLGTTGSLFPVNPFTGATPTAIQPTATTTPTTTPTASTTAPATTTPTDTKPTGPAAPPSSGTGLGGISALGRAPGVGLKEPKFVAPEGKSYETSAKEFYEGYETKAGKLDEKTDEAIKQANESVKGKAFEGYKKSLEDEALKAGAEKDQAKYMALFKAGLAMMAGTSRHAFENIGKGAMVGAEDYQAAAKDLKKAEKERQKEFAYIEQAQRAESLGDRDKAIDRLEKARERADSRLRYTGEGIYKATNLDKAQAYDIAKTQFNSGSDIFRTHLAGQYQLGAAGISADARMAALLATAGSRGQMTQKQVGDAMLQLQTAPETVEYRKKLIDKFGKNSANTPEFKQSMDTFVNGLFQKYYGNATRGGAGAAGGLNLSEDDMQLIRRHLATGG